MSLWVAIQSISQLISIYGQTNAETLLDNMDTQIFYRQTKATAKYLEEELGETSEYSHSHSTRESGHDIQGLSEQAVPLLSATEIKQMEDGDVIIRHHNLPPLLGSQDELARTSHSQIAASLAAATTPATPATDTDCTAPPAHPRL